MVGKEEIYFLILRIKVKLDIVIWLNHLD